MGFHFEKTERKATEKAYASGATMQRFFKLAPMPQTPRFKTFYFLACCLGEAGCLKANDDLSFVREPQRMRNDKEIHDET